MATTTIGADVTFQNDLGVDLSFFSPLQIDVTHLPKIQVGVDPLKLTINPLTINGDVSLRIKEFPSIRGHVPADFTVGLSFLGFQLFCLRLCGEAQIITEPYHPNPCERCDDVITVVPTPVEPIKPA